MTITVVELTDSIVLRSLEKHTNGDPLFDRVLTISTQDGVVAELKIETNGEAATFGLSSTQARLLAGFLTEVGGRNG